MTLIPSLSYATPLNNAQVEPHSPLPTIKI
jgi:hypothetical protein